MEEPFLDSLSRQFARRLADIERTNTCITEKLVEDMGDTLTLHRKIREQANERDDLEAELRLLPKISRFARMLQARRAGRELVVDDLKQAGRLHNMVREIVEHVTLTKDDDNRLMMKVTC